MTRWVIAAFLMVVAGGARADTLKVWSGAGEFELAPRPKPYSISHRCGDSVRTELRALIGKSPLIIVTESRTAATSVSIVTAALNGAYYPARATAVIEGANGTIAFWEETYVSEDCTTWRRATAIDADNLELHIRVSVLSVRVLERDPKDGRRRGIEIAIAKYRNARHLDTENCFERWLGFAEVQ